MLSLINQNRTRLHIKVTLSLLIFCLAWVTAEAQPSPITRQYSVEDGLPSSQISHILQDSKGYIWVATDRGVSRFDGTRFQNFTADDGLPDNDIIRLYEDRLGKIWFLTGGYNLAYFQHDSISVYLFNDVIRDEVGYSLLSSFLVDTAETVHLGFLYSGYFTITRDGEMSSRSAISNVPGVYVSTEPDQSFFFGVKGVERPRKDQIPAGFRFFPRIESDDPGRYHFKERKSGNYVLAENNRLQMFSLGGDTLENQFEKRITGLFEDNEGNLWVSFFKGGVKRYFGSEIRPERRASILSDLTVNTIFQDREGSLWIGTSEDGIYFMPSTEFLTINGLMDDYINVMETNGRGLVYLGLRNGIVHTLTSRGDVLDTLDINFGGRLSTPVSTLLFDNENDELWVSTSNSIALFANDQFTPLFYPDLFGLKHFIKSSDGSFWTEGRNGLYRLGKSSVQYRSSTSTSRQVTITALFEDSKNQLWVGAQDGLLQFRNGDFINMAEVNPMLRSKVVGFAEDANSNLLLATSGQGLIVWDGKKARQISVNQGLASNIVSSVVVDETNSYWVGTNRGLNRVTLQNDSIAIRTYTKRHGLVSDEIQQVKVNGGNVWVVTNKGATFFRPENAEINQAGPPVYLKSIKINNSDTTLQDDYQLRYDQNFLQVDFVGLAFREAGQVRYRYRLLGLETDWNSSNNNTVQYTTLPSGEYEFQVQASNEDGIWSETINGFSFTISKPFWETWWFILFSILIVGAAIWGGLYYRITQIQEQNRIANELNNYKHQALSAQMNPHFVFNSLNSIQNFILQNDKKAANRYLSKFARLMRLTLDNSREIYVSMQDELTALDLYMELEKLRFKNKFDYSIIVDPNLDQSAVKIPSSLIQPYVENAIWHGILHKESEGRVDVEIKEGDDQLLCSVQDDGIGREKAMEIKRQNRIKHKSAGMNITEKRLELINSVHKSTLNYKIIDLKENGVATGTRVEFNIPLYQ